MPYSKTQLSALQMYYQDRQASEESRQARPSQPASSSSARYTSPPRETITKTSGSRPRQTPQQAISSTPFGPSTAGRSSKSRSYPAPSIMTGDSIRRGAAKKHFDKVHAERLKRLQERYLETHKHFEDIQSQLWREQNTFYNIWVRGRKLPVSVAETSALDDILEIADYLPDRVFVYEKLDPYRDSDPELYFKEKERMERGDIADMKQFMRASMLLTGRYR